MSSILNSNMIFTIMFLIVLVFRFVLRKGDKRYVFVLWILLFSRLAFPFTINLLSQSDEVLYQVFEEADEVLQMSAYEPFEGITIPYISSPMSSVRVFNFDLSVIYFAVVFLLVIRFLIHYIKLKHKLIHSAKKVGSYYESESIENAFVFGFLKPRIYLPVGLTETQKNHILHHERIHIQRKDYIVKPFVYVVCILYWYNPIVWVSYILMSKDMEMICDEHVVKPNSIEAKDYSLTLLEINQKAFKPSSVIAFSSNETRSRIMNLMKPKRKEVKRVIAVAGMSLVLLVFMFVDFNKVYSDYEVNIHTKSGTAITNELVVENELSIKMPTTGHITAYYGVYKPFGVERFHSAIDIANAKGTEIYAALKGTVIKSSFQSDAGYFIEIDHGDGVTTFYAHCDELFVEVGDQVNTSTLIASMGRSGKVTGYHLHFELSIDGKKVNPLDYIKTK